LWDQFNAPVLTCAQGMSTNAWNVWTSFCLLER